MRFLNLAFCSLITSLTIFEPAMGAELVGTLRKIKESGVITLGQRDSSIPFSYTADSSGQSIGYSQDIQLRIVEAIQRHLDLPYLKPRFNLVTSQTRIPLVLNGTVDLECGSTTNNPERGRQVDFSVGIFSATTKFLTKKDSSYYDFSDLAGKNVVTTAGSTSERLLRSMNADEKMGMFIISAKDIGESYQILETGRAVAFMLDDAALAGERAKAKNPDDWVLRGSPQSSEIYGCMMRKNDSDFKKLVDDTIRELYTSGEITSIYDKWFNKPIPPNGVNLNFAMTPALKELINNPTDKPATDK